MPPKATRASGRQTRGAPSDDQSEAHDVEEGTAKRKRNRKPVSCAECRRMKLKCDRQVPCSTCSKRGCAALCPNGVLAAGHGNKLVLADTEHLHEKIAAMGHRISELEYALAELQAQISNKPHPLLSDELKLVKAPLSTQSALANLDDAATESLAKSLGTLTLGDRPHFVGPHAMVDYILMDETVEEISATSDDLPVNLALISTSFPIVDTGAARPAIRKLLVDHLPPAERAWNLIERYYISTGSFGLLIPLDEVKSTVFSRIYGSVGPQFSNGVEHDMALLFMYLASGSLLVGTPTPRTISFKYFQLAKVALGLDSVIDHPTIEAICALHLMAVYVQLAELGNGDTASYLLTGLTARLCQSLGLHRDDTLWDISLEERQRRRRIFWEIASYEGWISFSYGRPSSFTMIHLDAKLADLDNGDNFMDDSGRSDGSYWRWMHGFTAVLFKVMDQAFCVAPLSYATVIRLDQLVREHSPPDYLRTIPDKPEEPDTPIHLFIQRHCVVFSTESLLLFLHRTYFARALLHHPDDPLKSKYAQSVLTVFRASVQLHASVRALNARAPTALSAGHWVFWSQCFSACLALASILIKAPASGLAPPAMVELDETLALLEDVAPTNSRIMRMMPRIRKLHTRAHETYEAFKSTAGTPPQQPDDSDDVTQIGRWFLWGPTRIVDRTGSRPSTVTADPSLAVPRNPGISVTPLTRPVTSSASSSLVPGPSSGLQPYQAVFGLEQIQTQPTDPSITPLTWPVTSSNFSSPTVAGPSSGLQAYQPLFGLEHSSIQAQLPSIEMPPPPPPLPANPLGLDDFVLGGHNVGMTAPVPGGAFDTHFAMNWTPSEMDPFAAGMMPDAGEYDDLAWHRFVSDIGFHNHEFEQ